MGIEARQLEACCFVDNQAMRDMWRRSYTFSHTSFVLSAFPFEHSIYIDALSYPIYGRDMG